MDRVGCWMRYQVAEYSVSLECAYCKKKKFMLLFGDYNPLLLLIAVCCLHGNSV